MDAMNLKEQGLDYIRKYRYVILVLILGILLLLSPEEKPSDPIQQQSPNVQSQSLQAQLQQILSRLKGAGQVEVLLTEAAGTQTYFQTDERDSQTDSARDRDRNTVLVNQSGSGQTGLVTRRDPPRYLGAVILCTGAENPEVKLAIVEAVSDATGLSTDKISVLKMK